MIQIAALFILFFANISYANFNISPLSQSIDIKEKSASYTLENLTNRKAAYEVDVASRSLSESGEELRGATKDIRVFPSKIILEPQQKKRIKVIYLGKKNISKEKSFRVVFKQLDRNVSEDDQEGLNAKFNFHTAFYITPKNAEPELTATVSNGPKGTQLALQNRGNKHIILDDWKLKLSSENGSIFYDKPLPDINMLAETQVFLPLQSIGKQYQQAEVILN
ncbi:fimbria/pilus periplasmic chaperone [Vibrio renipiscarius]|uniref:Pili assembly chaperone N-terminal domain-containing protein n=1 Tax=Vibrio renipiscarius TaxID=1461322 RepID=A0A0C2NR43_9VIBR|nr:fimbria/pilus periplasmic chaperone [Vibrio renipiscarius]KII76632.1 hypothetical protein OJ16_17785 [Vibrio renipiscarius]KII77848.1 hypothetical protein PL18_12785 [Vibrio renipiscarius]